MPAGRNPSATSSKSQSLGGTVARTAKRSFDIHLVMRQVREAVRPLPKAALFELYDRGYTSVFEQLVACMISIRTLDEVTIPTALKLFGVARTPAEASQLSDGEIDDLIRTCSFHEVKARNIRQIAQTAMERHGGVLPCDEAVLLGLPGIGPKCANLVLGIACAQSRIGVDIHVHRITNRWGFVCTRSPEQTMTALEAGLPKDYWVEINRLLVPFGKYVCTGVRPHCSACPVLEMCRQVGVTTHR